MKTENIQKNENNATELVFILDRSGSMGGLEDDTVGAFNAMIGDHREKGGETYVTTILFDHVDEVLHDRVKLSCVAPLTREDYFVRGCTALLDAVGNAIEHIESVHKYARPEDVPSKTLFVITTDGMENASRRFTKSDIKKKIEKKKKEGWDFIFIGANIDAVETAQCYGINAERAIDYHADKRGTGVIFRAMSKAVGRTIAGQSLGSEWREEADEDYSSRN